MFPKTYALSIGCVCLKRLRTQPLPPARWPLGRGALVINALAVLHACWLMFWSFWPSHFRTTAATFNWAPMIFVGVMCLAMLKYWQGRKSNHEGPVAGVQNVLGGW